jgi:hypothetical protein
MRIVEGCLWFIMEVSANTDIKTVERANSPKMAICNTRSAFIGIPSKSVRCAQNAEWRDQFLVG